MSITQYLSARPARFFEEISAIPRASQQEGRIAEYLVRFAQKNGLEYDRDGADNLLIKKQGSRGREGEPPLLLQAHTDMVTEIAFGVSHDFSREGVRLLQKGNILTADGTTLGADDGFGVALMLAVLEDEELSHPPLECLFTAAEEIGLVGAGRFDYSKLRAKRMLNFDSAEEHLIIEGCCGGIRSDLYLPMEASDAQGEGLKISLHGLAGGHSGEDIHRGRANALSVMGEILKKLEFLTPFAIVSLFGGDKDNAIPRDCEAVILPHDPVAAARFFSDREGLLRSLVTSLDDAARTLTVSPVAISTVSSVAATQGALAILRARNGVFCYRADGGVPDTSRNLASVRAEAGEWRFTFSSRSPSEAKLDSSVAELDELAASVGGHTVHRSRYPGWESTASSPVCELWQWAYYETTGKVAHKTVIHAGLECGLISAKIPSLDVISVGCNVYDLHTPEERMELDSFDRIYRTLLAFLKAC